jgi:hypothetical protein
VSVPIGFEDVVIEMDQIIAVGERVLGVSREGVKLERLSPNVRKAHEELVNPEYHKYIACFVIFHKDLERSRTAQDVLKGDHFAGNSQVLPDFSQMRQNSRQRLLRVIE